MEEAIKTIIPQTCPHCQGQFFVEFKTLPPVVNGVYSASEVSLAKSDVLSKLIALNLSPEKLQEVMAWVNNPETIFGPSEVAPIIASLKNDNT